MVPLVLLRKSNTGFVRSFFRSEVSEEAWRGCPIKMIQDPSGAGCKFKGEGMFAGGIRHSTYLRT
jgi:hypothetical protein